MDVIGNLKTYIKSHQKQLIILLIIFVLVLVIIFIIHLMSHDHSELSGNGTIETDQIIISSQQSGQLKTVTVYEGDSVTPNQLLATIDDSKIRTQIAATKAKIQQIELTVHSFEEFLAGLQAQTVYAKITYDRSEALVKEGNISVQKRDSDYNEWQKALANFLAVVVLRNAEVQNLVANQAQLKELQINLNQYNITAPSNGIIQNKLVEPGEIVAVDTRLFVMEDPNDLYMMIYLPTNQAGKVKINDKARIKLDAFPTRYFDAYVAFIADRAEFTPKQVETKQAHEDLVFRVKLRLINPPPGLVKPGMPGDGYIWLH